MGIFESIKSAFSSKADQESEVTTSPSQALRNAGINPDNLKFTFSTGTIGVSGEMADAADRQRILDVLTSLPDISAVQDHMTVPATESPAEPEVPAAPEAPPTAEAGDDVAAVESEDNQRMYTVEAGDTLWKIAQDVYGDGSKYTKIFEANTSLLKDPDHIYPGQKLLIPEIGD